MKKSISLFLAIIMLFSVVNVTAFAANIATPKATSSNDVGGIKIYWSKVDGAVKYEVYRRDAGSSSWALACVTTGTQVIDNVVTNGKYYAYSVRAYDKQNNYSVYDKALTYTTKCVATPKLTSLVNDTNGLKLTWGAVSGASYRVYRRGAGSTSWTYLGTTNSTTFTDSKATSGKYWRYTVRAVSSGYYSGFDTNGLYTMRLANPYSITASNYYKGVDLDWAEINGATGYRIYRRGAGQSYWTYIGETTYSYFRDGNVELNKYYRYTVRATRGSVYSSYYPEGVLIQYATPIKEFLPIEMNLMSGAGGWCTVININKDCSFTGKYSDGDLGDRGPGYPNGTIFISEFSGKFTNVTQFHYSGYKMKLNSYKLKHKPGTVWYENGYRYIAAEPQGIANGKNFEFYAPEAPIYLYDDAAIIWYQGEFPVHGKFISDACLYNVDEQAAFYWYDRSY